MPLSLQHGRIMTPSFQCCWAATIACPQVWIFKEHAQQNENVCPTIWSVDLCWFISATNIYFPSSFYLMASVVFCFCSLPFRETLSFFLAQLLPWCRNWLTSFKKEGCYDSKMRQNVNVTGPGHYIGQNNKMAELNLNFSQGKRQNSTF